MGNNEPNPAGTHDVTAEALGFPAESPGASHAQPPSPVTAVPEKAYGSKDADETYTTTHGSETHPPVEKRFDGSVSASPLGQWQRILAVLNWMPQNCRYDPDDPPKFTNSMNILLAFVSWGIEREQFSSNTTSTMYANIVSASRPQLSLLPTCTIHSQF